MPGTTLAIKQSTFRIHIHLKLDEIFQLLTMDYPRGYIEKYLQQSVEASNKVYECICICQIICYILMNFTHFGWRIDMLLI